MKPNSSIRTADLEVDEVHYRVRWRLEVNYNVEWMAFDVQSHQGEILFAGLLSPNGDLRLCISSSRVMNASDFAQVILQIHSRSGKWRDDDRRVDTTPITE